MKIESTSFTAPMSSSFLDQMLDHDRRLFGGSPRTRDQHVWPRLARGFQRVTVMASGLNTSCSLNIAVLSKFTRVGAQDLERPAHPRSTSSKT